MKQKDDTRRLIIGAPLLLIMAMCFGFYLVHPGGIGVNRPASSSPATSKKASEASSTPVNQLAPLPMTETTLPTLPPAVGESSSPNNAQPAGVTASHNSGKAGKNVTTKSGTSDDTSRNGLIQAVVNSLLNGR